MTFGGKKLCADYNLFYDLEQADPCGNIYLLILKDGDVYWEGYFSTSMGEWDLDNQTFSVTPLVIDDYNDILDEADVQYNILSVTPAVSVDIYGTSTTYSRNRWFMDVIEYLADIVAPGCVVSSTFFTEAINPVTLSANLLTYLTIAQKSDILRPTSSNPATLAMMSWNDLMDILWGMFQVQWKYDGTIMTVEHISFFNATSGIDLRTQEIALRSNKYRYIKEEMPKYERWHFMEAYDVNFVGLPIWYDAICVSQDADSNVSEININVTTDLQYILDCIDADEESKISDDGFVILCNYESGGNYYVRSGIGAYYASGLLNIDLSWANLHNNYFRHNRVLLSGYMNNAFTTFISAQKTKIQEINAILCDTLDPDKYITTELGETWFGGEKGYVKKASIKPYGEVNFTLLYGPEDNENEGVELEKIINITEVKGPGLNSHFFAVCNQPADGDLTIDLYLTCKDIDDLTCDTATDTFTILTGDMTDSIIIPWCDPAAQPPICVDSYHADESGAPGWTVIWHYDSDSYCP